MDKVKKTKKLFVLVIALIDWIIGIAFPLLVYANGHGAWAVKTEVRDLLEIILTAPLVAFIGPGFVGFIYIIFYSGFRIGDRDIRLMPFENSLKFNAFLCLTSPIWTTMVVCEAMSYKPMINIYLVSIIIALLIYLGLALWIPREVQWALESVDRSEQENPDLINYYLLKSRMENDLEVYLQIKCKGISPDEYVKQKIEEMRAAT